jgi:hypothetical protein
VKKTNSNAGVAGNLVARMQNLDYANVPFHMADASTDRPGAKEPVGFFAALDRPVIKYLSTVVAAFAAGYFAYQSQLKAFHLDVVPSGTYALKKDITGTATRMGVLLQITNLIDKGGELKNDKGDMEAWLQQAKQFVHYLDLPPDSVADGRNISSLEKGIDWALEDPRLEIQVKKTLGALRGFRDAQQARTYEK